MFKTKPHEAKVAFSGAEGQVCFHYPKHLVIIDFAGGELNIQLNCPKSTYPNAAALVEIAVWAVLPNGDLEAVPAFPYSDKGFPLPLATMDQVMSILTWAQNDQIPKETQA